ncbi:hypothetical protein G4B84_012135 [Aspergillus flavus NRRL3357]|nr:uncharacterized protein G4B84_012135 [Aspergillus flavus NRRL3357]QMW36606.1 hypothetical protein G4B84_012135 [Aspergillus flavus NRRL3357]QMW48661.1 hypothetical protein G4B11_012179 [Aspergillus flavus]
MVQSPDHHGELCRNGVRNTTTPDGDGAFHVMDQAGTAPLLSRSTYSEARGDALEHSTPTKAEQASWHNDTSSVQCRAQSDRTNDGEMTLHTATSRSSSSTANIGVTATKGAQVLSSMRSHALVPQLSYNISSPLSQSSQRYWSQDSPFTPISLSATQEKSIPPAPLSSQEEAWLLRQFSAEVDPLLKAASIACAAKQQFLIGQLPDGRDIARRNYNTAISLLIDRLGNNDEPLVSYGFAATVICSCYAMLDAPASDWQRHLDGVFSFSKVRRVNGSSGGMEQASFWSIARQEVVCSIMHRSELRLDPDLWAIDLEHIGQEGSEDLVNNQVLTILAKVVNFMACSHTTSPSDGLDQWYKLRDLLEHWNRSVKDRSFMDPVSVYKTISPLQRYGLREVFAMFHLAQILLFTSCPTQDCSCLVAFRRIEVSMSNNNLANEAQPSQAIRKLSSKLGTADLLRNNDEREAAIMLLEDIENDLGWAAKYRAWDLRKLCTDI